MIEERESSPVVRWWAFLGFFLSCFIGHYYLPSGCYCLYVKLIHFKGDGNVKRGLKDSHVLTCHLQVYWFCFLALHLCLNLMRVYRTTSLLCTPSSIIVNSKRYHCEHNKELGRAVENGLIRFGQTIPNRHGHGSETYILLATKLIFVPSVSMS